MPCPPDARHARWLVNRTENPPGQRILDPRRRADARGELYNGQTMTVPVWAVARAPGWVCVEQKVDIHETWLAWLPAEDVRPVR